MSNKNEDKDKNTPNKKEEKPNSSNPFSHFLPTTPLNLSPRSDNNSTSPRTPRLQGEFPNSLRIQMDSPTSISNAMLTSGI
jgi:hypothetical protein